MLCNTAARCSTRCVSQREWSGDVLLRDGSTLRLQAPAPEDYEDIKRFYEGLSYAEPLLPFPRVRPGRHGRAPTADAGGIERFALIGRHGGRVVATCNYEGSA